MSLMHEVLGRAEGALTSAFAERSRLETRVWALEQYVKSLETLIEQMPEDKREWARQQRAIITQVGGPF